MKSTLAEQLLGAVMQWDTQEATAERPPLQAMASYKYDEYQQFAPGMRFIESLAVWIGQFSDPAEKRVAFDFVRDKLIFCSTAEMHHLVEVAYPDHILPMLLRQVAGKQGIEGWRVTKIRESVDFRVHRRRTLYIGLSDGSRIDVFRRANHQELSHEQIVLIYDSLNDDERVQGVLRELRTELSNISGTNHPSACFNNLVLVDDFSGSGLTYIRVKEDGSYTGKIVKLCRAIFDGSSPASKLVDLKDLHVVLVLYVATARARDHLMKELASILPDQGITSEVIIIQLLDTDVPIMPGHDADLDLLLDAHYRSDFEDRHSLVGGEGVKYGFGQCGLPVVLSHNTPNNSLYFLWVDREEFRGLFPRRSRHGG